MTPGPLLALVIGAVGAQGFWAAPVIITGHALLEIFTILLLIVGLSAFLGRPRVRAILSLVGGLALVWMGTDMVASARSLALSLNGSQVAQSWWLLMLWGAAISLANPYFTGWWATIGAGQMAHLQLLVLRGWNRRGKRQAVVRPRPVPGIGRRLWCGAGRVGCMVPVLGPATCSRQGLRRLVGLRLPEMTGHAPAAGDTPALLAASANGSGRVLISSVGEC